MTKPTILAELPDTGKETGDWVDIRENYEDRSVR